MRKQRYGTLQYASHYDYLTRAIMSLGIGEGLIATSKGINFL